MPEVLVKSDQDLKELERRHSSGGVPRRDVVIVRGNGSRLYDDRGRAYIDLGSAHGWAALGHSHPDVTQRIQQQAERLVSYTESGYNDQRALWFRELSAILAREIGTSDKGTLCRIHPCNSGTEAIEAALKVARLFTGRTDFIAFNRGFHGRTLGALSATANPHFRDPFAPLVPGFSHLPFNDVNALDRAIGEQTAGVILEVVQGEGGVHIADREFVTRVRDLCSQRGALVILDEIQTGLGRTGRWFACQHHELAPDIIALGKGLGGGVPMGAVAWRDSFGAIPAGTHGSTFGGGPLACAASRATLDVLERDRLIDRSARLGDEVTSFFTALRAPLIRAVRGLGLMVGIELRTRVGGVLEQLLERGVWALPAGRTVLRLLPPLTIADADLREALDIVGDALRGA